MKILIQSALWLVIAFLGYKVYNSIDSSVAFQDIKKVRFALAVEKLKDIRKLQLAHKEIEGGYASSFESLIQFADTAQFKIIQRRDSSFTRYDRAYRIDRTIDTVVVDILGYESVKDSLFKNSTAYKNLGSVTVKGKQAPITLKTSVVVKNETEYPTFKASISKRSLLFDQDDHYIEEEEQQESLEEVKGEEIRVGSLSEISTNGNWPLVYDK